MLNGKLEIKKITYITEYSEDMKLKISNYIVRHSLCDWGCISDNFKKQNEEMLKIQKQSVVGAYLVNNKPIIIATTLEDKECFIMDTEGFELALNYLE